LQAKHGIFKQHEEEKHLRWTEIQNLKPRLDGAQKSRQQLLREKGWKAYKETDGTS
jgi:hypothetical protein